MAELTYAGVRLDKHSAACLDKLQNRLGLPTKSQTIRTACTLGALAAESELAPSDTDRTRAGDQLRGALALMQFRQETAE